MQQSLDADAFVDVGPMVTVGFRHLLGALPLSAAVADRVGVMHDFGEFSPRRWPYFPSIPFFTPAVGGFGPSHTDNSTGLKAEPAMVSLSLPLMAKVVPVLGT